MLLTQSFYVLNIDGVFFSNDINTQVAQKVKHKEHRVENELCGG